MPMLGDLLAAARRSAGTFQDWLGASDPELMARVSGTAEKAGSSPTAYVRAAVSDFARFASEDDWAMLISRLRTSDDPGTVCLLAMVRWRLAIEEGGANPGPDQEEGVADERRT